jgi:hypothetical protein
MASGTAAIIQQFTIIETSSFAQTAQKRGS